MINNKKHRAFTLIELLVVIAIIGILATIATISLGSIRSEARDSKRVADIKQVQTALEMFYNDNNRYPTEGEWATGILATTTSYGTTTYMAHVPGAINPPDGSCNSGNQFAYIPSDDNRSYSIAYCLGGQVSSINSGANCATPDGINAGNNCNYCLINQQDCSWKNIGNDEFNGSGGVVSIYAYNNTPYVTFGDGNYNGKTTVMKYNGSNWVYVGNPGFSTNNSAWPSLFIDNGTLILLIPAEMTLRPRL